jgi:hypothetical protein
MKYRKKPVVIEAMQWLGEPQTKLQDAMDFMSTALEYEGEIDRAVTLLIPTLEGVMKCQPGDWIIKGVKGECYPCKPDIFAATYEAAA